MDDLTVGELWARRKQLENEAAVQLGHMIFEISRLEMNLGLCLVWVEGGGKLESLTKSVESLSLKANSINWKNRSKSAGSVEVP
jgi:hypothetical protein